MSGTQKLDKVVISPMSNNNVEKTQKLPSVKEATVKKEETLDNDALTLFDKATKNVGSLVTIDMIDSEGTLADIEQAEISWLWKNRLPRGEVIMLCGSPGTGKSTLACYLASVVTNGSVWPDGEECEKGGVVYISLEDDIATVLKKRMGDAHVDQMRVKAIKTVKNDEIAVKGVAARDNFLLPRDIGYLRKRMNTLAEGCSLVIFDTISSVSKNYENNEYVRHEVMPLLNDLARDTGACILLINHPRKGEYNQKNIGTAIGGAKAWQEMSRIVYLVTRDVERDGICNLQMFKENICPKQETLSYRIATNENDETFLQWISDEDILLLEAQKLIEDMSPIKQDIIQLLLLRDGAMSISAIAAQLPQYKYANVKTEIIQRLLPTKIIEQVGRGMYAIHPLLMTRYQQSQCTDVAIV